MAVASSATTAPAPITPAQSCRGLPPSLQSQEPMGKAAAPITPSQPEGDSRLSNIQTSSPAESAAASAIRTAKYWSPSQVIQTAKGNSASAVTTRSARLRFCSRIALAAPDLGRGEPEAALPVLEVGDGAEEVELAEVGPEGLHEDHLRVGRLPEQEVGDAPLPAGAHEQVERGQGGRPEVPLDG